MFRYLRHLAPPSPTFIQSYNDVNVYVVHARHTAVYKHHLTFDSISVTVAACCQFINYY